MDHNFFCGLWKFLDQKLYSDQNFFRPKTYFLYQNFFCSNETSIKSCLAWIFCQNKSNTLSWHLTANQCLEFFKVLNAMFRIVLILSADKDYIHFLRHFLKYLHKQHPFKSIGFDIKAIQSCFLYFYAFSNLTRPLSKKQVFLFQFALSLRMKGLFSKICTNLPCIPDITNKNAV